MTIATPPVAHAGLDFLGKAALVVLTFQAGGLAHMMVVRGLDGPPNGYLYLVMLAALFAGTQRRLARAQVARGAVTWFTASRAARDPDSQCLVASVPKVRAALIVKSGDSRRNSTKAVVQETAVQRTYLSCHDTGVEPAVGLT
jgi:hypothetical protein